MWAPVESRPDQEYTVFHRGSGPKPLQSVGPPLPSAFSFIFQVSNSVAEAVNWNQDGSWALHHLTCSAPSYKESLKRAQEYQNNGPGTQRRNHSPWASWDSELKPELWEE